MGNTTIIELNHDFSGEIRRNPEEFVKQLLDQMSRLEHNGDAIIGGQVVCSFHRSKSDVYDAWTAFKSKYWGRRAT